MGKKNGPSQPAAPDPVATSAAQATANKDAAISQANLNRIDQVTPQGSLTYQQIGTNSDGTPRYQQTQTLSADEQAKYDQNNKVALALNNLAIGNIGRVQDVQSKPFSFDGMTQLPGTDDLSGAAKRVADGIYGQYTSRLDPQYAQTESDMRSRLAAQGISENSDAYRRELDNFSRAKNDAYGQANYTAQQAGSAEQSRLFGLAMQGRQQDIGEASYLRNLPLNEIASLLGTGGGVASPTFNPVSQVGVAAPDYQGAVYQNFNAANSNYQNQQNARSQMLGSIFGTVGTAVAMSDRRVKYDVKRVGTLANGLATYVFRYVGDKVRQFGVMAQDVLKVRPDAVGVLPNGILYVDYRKVF